MSSFAELEADLFLAERAFKRVPSDQNKEALSKAKKAVETFDEAKATIKADKPVVTKKPVAPKAPAAPKPAAAAKATPVKAATPKAGSTLTPSITDDSKKLESEDNADPDQLRLELRKVLLEAGFLSNKLVKEYPEEQPDIVEKILVLDRRHSEIIAQIKAQNYSTAASS